jgi:hypothetical protein
MRHTLLAHAFSLAISIDNACLHKNTHARTLLLEVLSPIV